MIPVWLPDSVTPDLDRALHYTALWGLDGIELRVVDGPTRRVPHVNEKRLRHRLDESEMEVASILPELFEGAPGDRVAGLNDIAALPETVAFARRIGAPLVVAPAFASGSGGDAPGEVSGADLAVAADLVRRAAAACAKGGLRLALAHGPATAFPRAADLARLLDAAPDSGALAAWSPADALVAGESPSDGLAALGGHRIALVRVRDGRLVDDSSSDGGALRFVDAEVGAGSVGWPEIVRALAVAGFGGPLSLDVRAEPKARTGLRSAAALVAAIRAATRDVAG